MAKEPISLKTYVGDKKPPAQAKASDQTQEFKHGFAEGLAEERKHSIGRTLIVGVLCTIFGAFGALKVQEAVSIQRAMDVTLVGNALGNIARSEDENGNPVVTPPADPQNGKGGR